MIALQPSRATPKATVASFKPSGITYSKVVSTGPSSFTGAPAGPGPNTLQMEQERLQKQQVHPMMQALTNTARTKDPRLAKKEKPTLLKRMGLPTSNLESKGKRRESPTPRIEEISNGEEFLYKGIDATTTRPSEAIGSINIDNGYPKDQFEDWEMDHRYSSVFDDEYDPRQVHSTNHKIHTKGVSSQPNMYVACTSNKLRIGDVYDRVLISVNKNSIVNCANCQKESAIKFIADTGASDTFTNNLNDFVTFKKMTGSIQTVDDSSSLGITGYGTVFIKHKVLINGVESMVTSKLSPVYYAPGMAYRLMSIGSFLQKGYLLHGDKRKMTIRKPNGTSVMEFHPHDRDPSIYWLDAEVVKSKKSLSALAMSAQGYNLWHLCLGHPSAGILSQVPRHTTGGPDRLLPPTEHLLCKGCAQGKMTSSSFLDSSSRATEPSALIHSDLKTIPVISYHKYKYVFTFLDAHTNHGWVTFLKDKSSTYGAWQNFLAMVKTQYKKMFGQ